MSTLQSQQSDPHTMEAATAAARYLAEHGYENTTAGELADAIGISRSTFFRRFKSKEGVIFADHDVALAHLQDVLAHTSTTPAEVIARGAVGVMHHLIRDEHAARLRSGLLKQTPALRERELVITHRYERVFADYLARVVTPGTPAWVPIALASGIVAVHNAALRSWLRQPDHHALGALEQDLTALTACFGAWLGGEHHSARVVVAAFNVGASPDAVLRAIADQLH
jgi:AcrR family transcriptional regulator